MQIEEGAVLEGKVTGLKPFGAFIALAPDFKTAGLVHISQISNSYIEKVEDKLTLGQEVKVKVLTVENGKISLSIKALEEVPVPPRKEARPKKDFSEPKEKGAPPPVYTSYARPKKEATAAEPKDPFEEMMSRFKASSDEKISDLRKNVDNHRGGGYSRKGNKKF